MGKLVEEELYEQLEDSGFGGTIKRKYDAALGNVADKAYKGMLEVGASGFGKGLLITAGVMLAATALLFGFGGATGELFVNGAQVATFENGIVAGLQKGAEYLLSGFGITTLLGGGLVGAVADIRNNQNKLSGAEAERLKLEYERSRQQEQTTGKQPVLVQEQPTKESSTGRQDVREMGDISFAARELTRRSELNQRQGRLA